MGSNDRLSGKLVATDIEAFGFLLILYETLQHRVFHGQWNIVDGGHRPGDALDFWRVEAVEPDRMLRLRAEMKVPGDAWLQFEARPQSEGETLLLQTAFFAPKGLSGFVYWYGLYPIHGLIFSGMIRNLAGWAERERDRNSLPPGIDLQT